MSDCAFAMQLTPDGRTSSVHLDGQDLSKLLRGVDVHSDVEGGTSVTLIPKRGATATLEVLLPEAHVVIENEDTPLSPRDQLAVGDTIWFSTDLLKELIFQAPVGVSMKVRVLDIDTAADGTKTLVLDAEPI